MFILPTRQAALKSIPPVIWCFCETRRGKASNRRRRELWAMWLLNTLMPGHSSCLYCLLSAAGCGCHGSSREPWNVPDKASGDFDVFPLRKQWLTAILIHSFIFLRKSHNILAYSPRCTASHNEGGKVGVRERKASKVIQIRKQSLKSTIKDTGNNRWSQTIPKTEDLGPSQTSIKQKQLLQFFLTYVLKNCLLNVFFS